MLWWLVVEREREGDLWLYIALGFGVIRDYGDGAFICIFKCGSGQMSTHNECLYVY